MKHRSYSLQRWVLMAAFVVAAGSCHGCGRDTVSLRPYTAEESAPGHRGAGEGMTEEAPGEKTAAMADSRTGTGSVPAESEAVCYVHICGAVVNPGVYEIARGQRIYQVVERAGGYTQEAAADYLNLAAEVSDGMKLVVPTREELLSDSGESLYGALASQDMAEGSARVNLNTATKEQLMELSGIGEARAGDIIRYREEHGGFLAIEDIMKVPGIKDAAFQKIKDEVTV